MAQLPFQALADQALNPTGAFPFSIEETTGDKKRAIILRGQSLPQVGKRGEEGGVGFPTEMRVNVHYYPGNPIADTQTLGTMWGDTEIYGRWTDSKLRQDANAAVLVNFPPIDAVAGLGDGGFSGGNTFASSGTVPSDTARRARILRDAFYEIQRRGQLLKVTWGSIARFGYIANFDPRNKNDFEIYWSMTFKWAGDTDAPQELLEKPSLDPPGLLARLVALLQGFLDEMNRLLALIYGNIQAVQQKIRRIGTLVTDFIEIINQFTNLVFAPAEMFGVIEQQIASIKVAIQDLVSTFRAIPGAYSPSKEGADQEQINETAEAIAAIIANALALGLDIEEIGRKLAGIRESDILGVEIVQQGQSLRDIAREYYGNPTAWPGLAQYNGLTSSVVPAGTVVRIPRRD